MKSTQLLRSKCWVKVAAYVEKKLLNRLATMVNRLAEFNDIQSAFFLLRVSFSIVRATHFMRTTPISKWSQQAEKFDKEIWDAAQSILGFTLSEQSWKQACLTPRLGGLGLRMIVDHADIAFSASWCESKDTCGENWSSRDDVKGSLSQMRGSYKKDEDFESSHRTGPQSTRAPTPSEVAMRAFRSLGHCCSLDPRWQ